ncbi:hypothetical protein ACFVAV_33240 [Nocardia sp. NPDC057663]|uniref:hypothetical protein n=1 Tax=Nocardia sp. NPDC057663 TaxID=3346201 RepID=UPI003670966F
MDIDQTRGRHGIHPQPDGTFRHTYELAWIGNHGAAEELADYAAGSLAALIAAKTDPDSLADPTTLDSAITDVVRLQRLLEATYDELLWIGRGYPPGQTTPTREPVLSWREVTAAGGGNYRSTAQRRFEKLLGGTRAFYATRFAKRG